LDIQSEPETPGGHPESHKSLTFKGKPVKVVITDIAKDEFDALNLVVDAEIATGITRSDHQTLLNSIKQKVELLKANPQYGTHIQKDRIPKEYIARYSVSNLWKVNLSGAWRMIYTIDGGDVEIICLILDVLDHKRYEKTFGYRGKT
jgi:mRNA-degrading endonuclease RelE of RelBE toxin-antitoxin system